MEFKKIQLNGFKSFAEKTNFLIEEGLTGIVGPNGCGKSNIVESLRWCMGETSAKSMRGSGMEDVIFSGTSNKPSKNIAEVSILLSNENKDGPHQYRDLNEIQIRRKIEKDKGSKFYINDKEARAKDAQMFFADLSTGAHSPSLISQGRIGALVTAKPVDRRAILEEAAGIAGLHVRRHESELRLGAAENNLKRADELRKQQEKQLVNLQKQAVEATKYKLISEEIKKIEAGLYYLRLKDIDHEINLENEINKDAENEVKKYNEKIEEFEKQIKIETEKVEPIREKNIENLSRIQRLNLELQSLDEESKRIKIEIDNIKVSLKTIDEDIDREKSIVIDANSNEKRLKEEKNDLIEIDSKYYETEKLSNEDLEIAKAKLKNEQEKVDIILEAFNSENLKKNINVINEIKDNIIKAKNCIDEQKTNDAQILLDECQISLSLLIQNIAGDEDNNKISKINSKNENIKELQEAYAGSYSKNQSIKQESLKRNERIKTIEIEIESWKNLLTNSEKMVNQLDERKNKLLNKLTELEKQPQTQAEKKGQVSESLRLAEKEKQENEIVIEETDNKISALQTELNNTKENTILIRERKASSGATIDGLKKRRDDLLERVQTELNLNENNILEFSDLETSEKIPDAVTQEELLDAKKREVYRKLFNGGNAKLELVDSDDPLDAGLEMLVSPPGKRLQSITLLSGGEQALTALSLIFAVFLTNPSPICVLDEVDAPLDDANVTRFCNLLEELTKITSTKFVIVTHHALTMSKMDRLYGVTMPEKGISQLVSVDLQKAEGMVA